MKKLDTKSLNIFYAKILLDSFDEDQNPLGLPASERFQNAEVAFNQEYGWRADQLKGNNYQAFAEWLQGLPTACSIPFRNYDILRLAEATGHLQENPTDAQEQKILDNYWQFITAKFFYLKDRKQEWFDKNLKEEN